MGMSPLQEIKATTTASRARMVSGLWRCLEMSTTATAGSFDANQRNQGVPQCLRRRLYTGQLIISLKPTPAQRTPHNNTTPQPLISVASYHNHQAMTGSSQPEWQRSSIGITPLTVKPRAGSRRVKKFDVVGAGTARAEKQASNGAQVNIIFPGIGDRGGEEGVEGGGSSGSRQAAAGRVCSVCTRASADYSCPRCLIGYCSSKCYKVRHHRQQQQLFVQQQVPASFQ